MLCPKAAISVGVAMWLVSWIHEELPRCMNQMPPWCLRRPSRTHRWSPDRPRRRASTALECVRATAPRRGLPVLARLPRRTESDRPRWWRDESIPGCPQEEPWISFRRRLLSSTALSGRYLYRVAECLYCANIFCEEIYYVVTIKSHKRESEEAVR